MLKSLFSITLCFSLFAESELDRIIPPEVKNDAFYNQYCEQFLRISEI